MIVKNNSLSSLKVGLDNKILEVQEMENTFFCWDHKWSSFRTDGLHLPLHENFADLPSTEIA